MALFVETNFFHMNARLKKGASPPTRLIIIFVAQNPLELQFSRLPKLISNLDRVQVNKLSGQFRMQYN